MCCLFVHHRCYLRCMSFHCNSCYLYRLVEATNTGSHIAEHQRRSDTRRYNSYQRFPLHTRSLGRCNCGSLGRCRYQSHSPGRCSHGNLGRCRFGLCPHNYLDSNNPMYHQPFPHHRHSKSASLRFQYTKRVAESLEPSRTKTEQQQ